MNVRTRARTTVSLRRSRTKQLRHAWRQKRTANGQRQRQQPNHLHSHRRQSSIRSHQTRRGQQRGSVMQHYTIRMIMTLHSNGDKKGQKNVRTKPARQGKHSQDPTGQGQRQSRTSPHQQSLYAGRGGAAEAMLTRTKDRLQAMMLFPSLCSGILDPLRPLYGGGVAIHFGIMERAAGLMRTRTIFLCLKARKFPMPTAAV